MLTSRISAWPVSFLKVSAESVFKFKGNEWQMHKKCCWLITNLSALGVRSNSKPMSTLRCCTPVSIKHFIPKFHLGEFGWTRSFLLSGQCDITLSVAFFGLWPPDTVPLDEAEQIMYMFFFFSLLQLQFRCKSLQHMGKSALESPSFSFVKVSEVSTSSFNSAWCKFYLLQRY